MKTYLVKFTPQEPYFFGNEKSLPFAGQKNRGQMTNNYFVKSENVPLQTTILGAIRYMFLKNKKSDLSYGKADLDEMEKSIGRESFKIQSAEKQSFGVIEKVSPVFLFDGCEKYVVTPFDHIKGESIYTPFSDYDSVTTDSGVKLYSKEFNAKEGLASAYMSLTDGKIIENKDLFTRVTRVGINKNMDKKAFFKKQYSVLAEGFSFAVYLDVSDIAKVPEGKVTVFLGQGKSMFTAEFIEEANTLEDDIKKLLPDNTVYCLGDAVVDSKIYKCCSFACTKTRDYRAYITNYEKGRVEKDELLYKLICAGSVFIVNDRKEFSYLSGNKNCEQIGLNVLVTNQEGYNV